MVTIESNSLEDKLKRTHQKKKTKVKKPSWYEIRLNPNVGPDKILSRIKKDTEKGVSIHPYAIETAPGLRYVHLGKIKGYLEDGKHLHPSRDSGITASIYQRCIESVNKIMQYKLKSRGLSLRKDSK